MSNSRDFIGNSVSVGTGIKAYFRIKSDYLQVVSGSGGSLASAPASSASVFEVGLLNDIMVETNRDVAPQFVAGSRSAISYCSGKRLTSGKVSFAVFEKDFISYFVSTYVSKGSGTKIKTFDDFNSNQFGYEYDSAASKVDENFLTPSDVKYLDQLPPVDIILVGRGDLINSLALSGNDVFQIGDNFKMNAFFKMELENVRFLNDSFGISAGSALGDQVLDFIVCGKKKPWEEVK